MRNASLAAVFVVCGTLLAAAGVVAAQWETADDLSVSLSDSSGRVSAVSVSGEPVKLADAVHGGLSYREFTRNPDEPERTVLELGAEGDEKTWSPASFADWDAKGDFARRRTGDAPEGEAYLEIGDGKSPGVGMAATQSMGLVPGGECTISWLGRTHDTSLSYILCVRVFDGQGSDVTATSAVPQGWIYSPYSNAHYRVDPCHKASDTWERLSYGYSVPEGVTSALLSLRAYRDGDLRADIDDLRVTMKPGGSWTDETPIIAPVQAIEGELVQRAELPDAGLSFETRYLVEDGRLDATFEVSCAPTGEKGRCLRLLYRLPLNLTGWTWSADPQIQQTIEAGHKYEESVGLAGHRLSRYPLASVSDATVGLAMAVPMDRPAAQTFYADAEGLVTVADLGLTPQQSKARISLSLYQHDPTWAFRAALSRYYDMFPALFENRASQGGAWTLRLPGPDVSAPDDFRLAFYECGPLRPEAREYCREHGIETFVYSEPWGRRQTFPEAKTRAEMPPYDQRLAQVKQWAQEDGTEEKWRGAPRNQVAQAVLNSLLMGPDGNGAHLVDLYTTWAQWWQLSTDPDLPEPNIASICWQYEIEPATAWADGIYLDSVSMTSAAFEDHHPAHLAAADTPLCFSISTGQPVALSGFAHLEFMEWLKGRLNERGKLLMLNLFAPATRIYGHLGDVTGCETAGVQDDRSAMQQRAYACQRPVSNLLQYQFAVLKRVPAMTAEQMEDYFANQLLYGFWPGISTAGGGTEPGYRYMHRYFEDPGLFERDRPLFRKYMPVFDALHEAGWEPVTHARTTPAEIRIERFGDGEGALLTVHNPTADARAADLILERDWWVQAGGGQPPAVLTSELTGESYAVTDTEGELRSRVPVSARRTVALRVQREAAPAPDE